MLNKLKKIIKDVYKVIYENILVVLIIITFAFNCVITYYNYATLFAIGTTLNQLQNKIEIHEIQRRNDIQDIYNSLIKTNKLAIVNSEAIIKTIQKSIEIIKTIKGNRKIDIPEIQKIKEANVHVLNFTSGYSGSGTYIKYKNNFYILTCAHLNSYNKKIDKEPDTMYIELDDNIFYPITLLKIDRKKDLALYTVNFRKPISYLEISDEFPKEGSEVFVIGNPDGLTDIVTNGVISKVEKEHYIITNITFFGNSGGALLYKGKVVGVMSQLITYMNNMVFVNYGYTVNLRTIKEFLYYIKD